MTIREGTRWTGAWGCAHRNLRGLLDPGESVFTVSFPNNVPGCALRVKFGNLYGERCARIARCEVTVDQPEGTESLDLYSAEGTRDFVVPPGGGSYSAPARCSIPAGCTIEVRLTLPHGEVPASGNSMVDSRPLALVSGVEVLAEADVRVVACFGDSITHRGTWTAPLRDLLHKAFPGRISLLEMGVNGNRLLGDSAYMTRGASGLRRFPHDIMGIAGLTHVIFALGSNDLGHPGVKEWVPFAELPSLSSYARVVDSLCRALTDRGVRVLGATITPRSWSGEGDDVRERLRTEINDWILHSSTFDEVLDFSGFLSREGVRGLPPEFDSGDGVHINAEAGRKLANHTSPDLFAPGGRIE